MDTPVSTSEYCPLTAVGFVLFVKNTPELLAHVVRLGGTAVVSFAVFHCNVKWMSVLSNATIAGPSPKLTRPGVPDFWPVPDPPNPESKKYTKILQKHRNVVSTAIS